MPPLDSLETEARAPGRLGLLLAAAAFFCLALAGLLLWWRQGDAIFSHYLMSAVAWCF